MTEDVDWNPHPPSGRLAPRPEPRLLIRQLRPSLVALLVLPIIGVLGYRWIEGWSYLDSLWMVGITLTTIGYGEVHPLSTAGRLFTLSYLAIGFFIVGYAVTQVGRYLVDGGLQQDLREQRRRRRLDAMTDHVILIGYGRLGREVAAELHDAGVRTVVVDERADLLTDLPPSAVALVGDGTHDATLKAAGIARARGIAIATPHSATNVYITLAARQMSPTLAIVCRVDEPDAEEKARRAGANRLIRPFGVGGGRMAQALLHPEASDFVEAATTRAGRDLHLHDIKVGTGFPGGALGTLRVRDRTGALIVAIRRPDGTLVPAPGPEVALAEGDVVVVVGKPGPVAKLRAWLERGAPP